MKRMWIQLLAGIGALWLFGCSSIDEIPMSTDISLEELKQNMKKALDPENRYASLKSYTQTQLVSTPRLLDDPEEVYVTVKYQKPDKFSMITTTYADVDSEPVTGWIINAKGGWQVDYKRKKITRMTDVQLDAFHRLLKLDDYVTRLSTDFDKVELSSCRIGENCYYKLVCRYKNSKEAPVTLYVGMDDFLIRRVRTAFEINGTDIQYDSTIERYAMHDGVMIPVETSGEENGIRQNARILKFTLNPKFKDDEFNPPVF